MHKIRRMPVIPAAISEQISRCPRRAWPAVCALFAAAAGAQTPPESATAGIDSLEEVVVTAQKRSETILRVPISITAIGADALGQRGIKDLADIARAAPSLNITSNNGFGYSNVSIRGISSGTGAATTGFYLDDTAIQQRSDSLGPPLTPQVFDLERVEVLRGPQGTLYGAGAEGGAIRFIMPSPDLDQRSLRLRSEIAFSEGGDPVWEASAAGGAPLIDGKLGFRAGASVREQGGYIDRVSRESGATIDADSNNVSTHAARLALGWQPTEQLTITPAVFYQRSKSDDADMFWEERPRFQSEAKVAQPNDDEWTVSSLAIDYQLPAFSVRAISSYLSRKNRQVNDWSYVEPSQLSAIGIPGTTAPPGSIDVPGAPDWSAAMHASIDQTVLSQELRFTSNSAADARVSWVAGLYASRNRLHRVRNEFEDLDTLTLALFDIPAEFFFGVPSLPGPVGYAEDTTSTEKELSAFGNFSLRFTDQLQMTLGARVSHTEFSSRNFQDGPWNAGPGLSNGSSTDTPITPKVNLTYNLTTDNMLYATVAKGYRVGGGNPSYANNIVCQIDLQGADAPAVYDSDSVWSYELGTKNRFADGRADFSASVFRIDWSNIQSLIFMPTCGNIYTDNLGTATSQGADVEMHAQLARGLTLSLSAGYTDAKYTTTTTRVFGGGAVVLVDDGQQLAIPKTSGSMALYFERPMFGSDGDGYMNLAWNYAGSFERNPPAGVFGSDSSTTHAQAVQTVSLRLGARLGGFDVAVFADNLTNSAPQLLRYHETTASTVYRGRTLRPRTIGLALTYGF